MSFGLTRGRQLEYEGIGLISEDLPSFDEQAILDPREWFAAERRNLPFHLEIGSGKGTFLVQQAELQREVNFLGIEWAGEFFRYAADRVRRNELTDNVRLLYGDAVEFVRHRMPDSIVSVIHLYFPDPWPKKRHHKRRTVQDQVLRDFHRVLTDQGEVRIVTDHDEYWQWINETIDRCAALFDREMYDRPDSAGTDEVVGTNFERKYRREGRPFHAVTLRRKSD